MPNSSIKQHETQTALLQAVFTNPEPKLTDLLDQMRKSGESALYFAGGIRDHQYFLVSDDLGLAVSVLPQDGTKAAEPGYHPGSTEIYVVFQGNLVLEQLENGQLRTESLGRFGVAVIPPGRCHRVRYEEGREAASLIVKTNPHHKPKAVRCSDCVYSGGQNPDCILHRSWKQEQLRRQAGAVAGGPKEPSGVSGL